MTHPNLLVIGNSFPISSIRRKVIIEPINIEEIKSQYTNASKILSFWGHSNTLLHVNQYLGFDITPTTERPTISLSIEGFPTLYDITFHKCYIISPNYRTKFRPKIGEEVSADLIKNWDLLKITW